MASTVRDITAITDSYLRRWDQRSLWARPAAAEKKRHPATLCCLSQIATNLLVTAEFEVRMGKARFYFLIRRRRMAQTSHTYSILNMANPLTTTGKRSIWAQNFPFAANLSADALVRKGFKQGGMWNTPIRDGCRSNASRNRINSAFNFRQHAARDCSRFN